MKEPLVEIIVVHHKGFEILKDCLQSLKRTKYSNFVLTLVDNASPDIKEEEVKAIFPKVNIIKNKNNESFAKANNIALKRSKAKYCILLNNDTIQDNSWISSLVRFAEKHNEVSALQPKILSLKNRKMFEYAGAAGGYVDVYGYPYCRGRIFNEIEEDKGQYDSSKEIFWSCGVAMFLRRSTLEKIGYLDEDIGSYAEELDLCWRMNLAGYKQYVVPKSIVYHLGSVSWGRKENSFKKNYLLHRNHTYVLLKNYPRSTIPYIFPQKIILELIDFFAFLIIDPKRSLATLLSLISIIKDLKYILDKNKKINKTSKLSKNEVFSRLIRTPLVLRHFLLRERRPFSHYERYIQYEGYKTTTFNN